MGVSTERFGRVEPRLIECANGAWLAVSATGAPLRIGVVGASVAEAQARFEAAVMEWSRLLDEPGK